jgi:hypothetical protein
MQEGSTSRARKFFLGSGTDLQMRSNANGLTRPLNSWHCMSQCSKSQVAGDVEPQPGLEFVSKAGALRL